MKNNNVISANVLLSRIKLKKLKSYLNISNDADAISKAVDILVDNSEIERVILNSAGRNGHFLYFVINRKF